MKGIVIYSSTRESARCGKGLTLTSLQLYMPTCLMVPSCVVPYTQLQCHKTVYAYSPQSVDWCLPYRKVQTSAKRALLLQVNLSCIQRLLLFL